MPASSRTSGALEVHPLTPDRWNDLVALFTSRGSGQVRWCWCMYYRRSGRPDVHGDMTVAEHNRDSLKALVDAGTVPGLLGYRDGKPVA